MKIYSGYFYLNQVFSISVHLKELCKKYNSHNMSNDPLVVGYDRIFISGSNCGDSVADRRSHFIQQ